MNTRQTIKNITCALSVLFAVNTAAAIDEGFRSFAVTHLEKENGELSFKITNPGDKTVMLRLTAFKKGTQTKAALLGVKPDSLLVRAGTRREINVTYYGADPSTEGAEYDLKVEQVPVVFFSSSGSPDSPEYITARDINANITVKKQDNQITIQAENLTPTDSLKSAL